jgi:hypothetical protein
VSGDRIAVRSRELKALWSKLETVGVDIVSRPKVVVEESGFVSGAPIDGYFFTKWCAKDTIAAVIPIFEPYGVWP